MLQYVSKLQMSSAMILQKTSFGFMCLDKSLEGVPYLPHSHGEDYILVHMCGWFSLYIYIYLQRPRLFLSVEGAITLKNVSYLLMGRKLQFIGRDRFYYQYKVMK